MTTTQLAFVALALVVVAGLEFFAGSLLANRRQYDKGYRDGYQAGRGDERREQDSSLVAVMQATATPPPPARPLRWPAHPVSDTRTEVLPRIGSEAPTEMLWIEEPCPGDGR